MNQNAAVAGPRKRIKSAFTLLELLVVIAILGILASLLLPALSRGKQKAQGIACVNNSHQLMLGMLLYLGDNRDFFPPNPDDANSMPGHNWCSGSAGIGQGQEFNPDVLEDPERSLLVKYISGNVAVFRCPADKRRGIYQGKDPQLIGQTVPAARTYSMSQAVGTICPGFDAGTGHAGAPTLSVNGPWLDNTHEHRRNSPWATYGRLSDMERPGPSKIWVLLDEDASNLNDAAFSFGMADAVWYDIPGTYHNYGAGFAFADGHSETHAWKLRAQKVGDGTAVADASDKADWVWMRERTSAYAEGETPPAP